MTAFPELPIPAELAVDEPPFTDEHLDLLLDRWDDERGDFAVDDEATEAEGYTADAHHAAVVKRWRIEDDGLAEWACRRLALEQEETARLRAQADEWAQRIESWFVQASKRHERSARFFEDRLADYGLRRRDASGEPTLTLPSGVVRTSEAKPKVAVSDEEVLAEWVEEHWAALAPDEAVFDDVTSVVKRSAKVYVGPLRKLLRVGRVEDGWDVRVLFACGHEGRRTEHGEDFPEGVPSRGEVVPCAACQVDRPVETSIVETRWRLIVLGPDDVEVPGAVVEPGGVTVKVSVT